MEEKNTIKERVEQAESEIRALKQLLAQSDYKAMKFFEGWISEEEYLPVKMQREEYRMQINILEEELEKAREDMRI